MQIHAQLVGSVGTRCTFAACRIELVLATLLRGARCLFDCGYTLYGGKSYVQHPLVFSHDINGIVANIE